MRISIDRESGEPLYLQISNQIRRQILTGELDPGFCLPSERKLADNLSVNRTTILNAYSELKAEGLLDSQVGRGTVVISKEDEGAGVYGNVAQGPAWNQLLNRYSGRFDSVLVQDLLRLASRNDVISFATGIASPETGPLQALRGIEQELLDSRDYKALLHSPTEGFLSLRKAVCGLMQRRGVCCRPEEVMMLSGSQQGIDLAARIFVEPGDVVVVEEPTYFPAIQVFRAAGARVMGIPVDENGMRIDHLEQLLSRYRPKLVYTIPTFQNPTGVTLEVERRKKLAELAVQHNFLVLEDDAYGDLCYEGHLPPLLKTLDREGYVVYLSTFSKNIYSGLRLGWAVAHRRIIGEFAAVKQLSDLHSSSLSQWIVERYIREGSFDRHLDFVCQDYRKRRDLMLEALSRFAPRDMLWNSPKGGYYIWCRLPDGISADKLLQKAADHKVSFVPGPPFYASGDGDDRIRLNFTFAQPDAIEEGIRRLCKAIDELDVEKDGEQPLLEINPII